MHKFFSPLSLSLSLSLSLGSISDVDCVMCHGKSLPGGGAWARLSQLLLLLLLYRLNMIGILPWSTCSGS